MPSPLGFCCQKSDVVPCPSSPPAPSEAAITQPSPHRSILLCHCSTPMPVSCNPNTQPVNPPLLPQLPSTSFSSALLQLSPNPAILPQPFPDPSHMASRQPRTENQIDPSSLQPHILTKHRLQDWETPWSLEHHAKRNELYGSDVARLAEVTVGGSVVADSLESYTVGLLRFDQFCDLYKVDERIHMPANNILISAFIGHYLGKVSGSSLNNWLSSLKMWHDMKHAPWCGGECWVQMCRRNGN
ncbi:hypothetical protein D9758_016022 [Tetrapyrgos nigripes]|uniref:Uncharacterized protein n=1 Tax=Tetrapyrgos nigripes TaxID=182062 RepID=A0A8H5CKQ4_9AGAR|nr:hypothetical protein D9758_016022 [Tetrapyrgos nigripes]